MIVCKLLLSMGVVGVCVCYTIKNVKMINIPSRAAAEKKRERDATI